MPIYLSGLVDTNWLKDATVTTPKMADGNVTTQKMADGNVTTLKLADANVTLAKLKLLTGTWSISIPFDTASSVQLTDYSHFPKQSGDGTYIRESLPAAEGALPTTQQYILFVYNTDPGASHTWAGTYQYHSASEQYVEVYKDFKGKVIAVHVTEKGNDHSIRLFDKTGKEISLSLMQFDSRTDQDLFDENLICLKKADEILSSLVALDPSSVPSLTAAMNQDLAKPQLSWLGKVIKWLYGL